MSQSLALGLGALCGALLFSSLAGAEPGKMMVEIQSSPCADSERLANRIKSEAEREIPELPPVRLVLHQEFPEAIIITLDAPGTATAEWSIPLVQGDCQELPTMVVQLLGAWNSDWHAAAAGPRQGLPPRRAEPLFSAIVQGGGAMTPSASLLGWTASLTLDVPVSRVLGVALEGRYDGLRDSRGPDLIRGEIWSCILAARAAVPIGEHLRLEGLLGPAFQRIGLLGPGVSFKEAEAFALDGEARLRVPLSSQFDGVLGIGWTWVLSRQVAWQLGDGAPYRLPAQRVSLQLGLGWNSLP